MSFWSAVGSVGAELGLSAYQDYRNRKEASRERRWEEEMSNTAHQREVADLRAAGLNPILSANKGASTPSVSAAPQGKPDVGKALESTSALMNMSAIKEQARADKIKAENEQEIQSLYNRMLQDPMFKYAMAFPQGTAAGIAGSSYVIGKMFERSGKNRPYVPSKAPSAKPSGPLGKSLGKFGKPMKAGSVKTTPGGAKAVWLPGLGWISAATALGMLSFYGNSKMDKSEGYDPDPFKGSMYRPW